MDDPPPKFEELLEDAKECQKMKKDEFTFRDASKPNHTNPAAVHNIQEGQVMSRTKAVQDPFLPMHVMYRR